MRDDGHESNKPNSKSRGEAVVVLIGCTGLAITVATVILRALDRARKRALESMQGYGEGVRHRCVFKGFFIIKAHNMARVSGSVRGCRTGAETAGWRCSVNMVMFMSCGRPFGPCNQITCGRIK